MRAGRVGRHTLPNRAWRPADAFALESGNLIAHPFENSSLDEQSVLPGGWCQPVTLSHCQDDKAALGPGGKCRIAADFHEIVRKAVVRRIGRVIGR